MTLQKCISSGPSGTASTALDGDLRNPDRTRAGLAASQETPLQQESAECENNMKPSISCPKEGLVSRILWTGLLGVRSLEAEC